MERALETLARMTQLDPENIPVRIKYAEALSKAGRTEEAAEAFEAGALLLRDQGRMDDYIKVAERLLFHRPTDADLARELAELYLDREDPKRALGKLQLSFKADPRHVPTLELLARAFEQLGQTPKTISVYKEIARIHQDAGRNDERARTLKHILDLDPADAEARQALASYAPRGAVVAEPPPGAIVESSAPPRRPDPDEDVEILEEDDDDVILADEAELLEMGAAEEHVVDGDTGDEEEESMEIDVDVAVSAPPTGSKPPVAAAPSIPPDVAREAQIARLLTECDVFARYGLKAKVIEQLQRVIEVAPEHIEARERLKDAYLDQDRRNDAIEQLYALATLFETDSPNVALIYYTQIAELDPSSEPAATKAMAADAAPMPVDDTTSPEPTVDDEVLFVDDESALVSEEEDDEIITMDGDIGPVAVQPVLNDTDAGDATIVGELPETAPKPALRPISPEEFEAGPVRPSSPGEVAAAVQRASLPPGEVEEILDEAEFFLAQGLVSEAKATLSEALSNHPEHPLLLEKLTELAELEIATASQPPAAASSADESFLLAEKLAEELGPTAADPTEPVATSSTSSRCSRSSRRASRSRSGSRTATPTSTSASPTRRWASSTTRSTSSSSRKANPQRECIAHTMIGLCHVEKGEITEAIARFKKGLYADNKTEREELGLYFELGVAYELLHDPKESLYYFQKVQKREPRFRNVEDSIRALTQPKAPPTPDATAADDRRRRPCVRRLDGRGLERRLGASARPRFARDRHAQATCGLITSRVTTVSSSRGRVGPSSSSRRMRVRGVGNALASNTGVGRLGRRGGSEILERDRTWVA